MALFRNFKINFKMEHKRSAMHWEIEAKKRLAVWRQQFSMVRVLAHGEKVLEAAAKRGVKIDIEGTGLKECLESPSFEAIQVEASRKLAKWDDDKAEEVVYSSFLVDAAKEAGVDVERLVKMPMMSSKKDQSVQVDLPCPNCVQFKESCVRVW